MLNIKQSEIEEFFEKYLKLFGIVKATYVTNRYLKNVLKISPEVLRSKKMPQDIKDIKNILILKFKKLIQKAVKEGIIEKVPYGHVLIKSE